MKRRISLKNALTPSILAAICLFVMAEREKNDLKCLVQHFNRFAVKSLKLQRKVTLQHFAVFHRPNNILGRERRSAN